MRFKLQEMVAAFPHGNCQFKESWLIWMGFCRPPLLPHRFPVTHQLRAGKTTKTHPQLLHKCPCGECGLMCRSLVMSFTGTFHPKTQYEKYHYPFFTDEGNWGTRQDGIDQGRRQKKQGIRRKGQVWKEQTCSDEKTLHRTWLRELEEIKKCPATDEAGTESSLLTVISSLPYQPGHVLTKWYIHL